MNDHVRIVTAAQKRIDEGVASIKRRKRKARESYRCYLAYMKIRKLI